MAQPATQLDAGNPSLLLFSKTHHSPTANNNNSSRTSEEERENTDGAVDELHPTATAPPAKRPRGRPPGSKNKPKAPIYLSVDPQDAMRSHVIEVASGADIAASLATYARVRRCCVAVVHATGSVSGVTFRHHLFLKGKLDIVSLSGTVLPENTTVGPAGLTVFVSGPHGQVMGGTVEGRLVAEGAVLVMAATFATATYEKLPLVGSDEEVVGSQNPGMSMEDPDPGSGGYHTGGSMNMGMGNGSHESSYAWFLQQQNNNVRSLYLNN